MANILKKDVLDSTAYREFKSAAQQKALHIKYRDKKVPEDTKIIEKKADRMLVEAIPGFFHLIIAIVLVIGTVIGVAALIFEPSRTELIYQWEQLLAQLQQMLGL